MIGMNTMVQSAITRTQEKTTNRISQEAYRLEKYVGRAEERGYNA